MLILMAFLVLSFCLSYSAVADPDKNKDHAQEIEAFLASHPYPCHGTDVIPAVCLLDEAISYMEKGEETRHPMETFDTLTRKVAMHGASAQKEKILSIYDDRSERLEKWAKQEKQAGRMTQFGMPTYGNKVVLLLSLNRLDDAVAAAEFRIKNGPEISVSQLPHVAGLWYLVGQNRLDDGLEFMRRTKGIRFSGMHEFISGGGIASAPIQLLGALLRVGREHDAKELVDSLTPDNIYKYASIRDDPQMYLQIYHAYKKDPAGEARRYFAKKPWALEKDDTPQAVEWRVRRQELETILSSPDTTTILPKLMKFREQAKKEGKWTTLSYPPRTKTSSREAQDFLWREYVETRRLGSFSQYPDHFAMSKCIFSAIPDELTKTRLIVNSDSFLEEEYAETLGLTLPRN